MKEGREKYNTKEASSVFSLWQSSHVHELTSEGATMAPHEARQKMSDRYVCQCVHIPA
jgi:hypothetical protein